MKLSFPNQNRYYLNHVVRIKRLNPYKRKLTEIIAYNTVRRQPTLSVTHAGFAKT